MQAVLDIADNWLNLTRLELTVFADNERAVRLYTRTGFEVEGSLSTTPSGGVMFQGFGPTDGPRSAETL